MNDMSATVEEIASSAEEVSSTARTAVEHGKAGQQQATRATEEIQSIESQVDEAAAKVRTIDDEMEQISEIVGLITNIAEQTNLLALNASIEAARAGEAGKGFAVVADEIKALAEETTQATEDVGARIADLQAKTDETVDGMEAMRQCVETGAETIEETIELFDEIADAIEETESGIQEISSATDDQAASSEEVVAMVDDVFAVGEETASEAGEVSAATEEQASSVSEASQAIQQLSRLADDLHNQVSSFELRAKSSGATPTGTAGDAAHSAATTDGGFTYDGGDETEPAAGK